MIRDVELVYKLAGPLCVSYPVKATKGRTTLTISRILPRGALIIRYLFCFGVKTLPHDIPTPKGVKVVLTHYYNANLMHNVLSGNLSLVFSI